MGNAYKGPLAVRKRDSNIELLRVISMCLIITHHCVLHGGAYKMDFCINKWTAVFLLPGGKICFDAFVAISMFYLTQTRFKTERFLKIWMETLYYSVFIGIIAYFLGAEMSGRDIFSLFFPITGNVQGYAAAYMLTYALIPFLSIVADKINRKQQELLLAVLAVSNIFSLIIGNFVKHFQKIYDNIGFFILCYFLVLYIKRYFSDLQTKKFFWLMLFIISWMFYVFLYVIHFVYPDNNMINFLISISTSHTSIPCMIGGFSLFFYFKNIRIGLGGGIINFLAKPTLAILMIHDHNFFRKILWIDLLKCPIWYYSNWFVLLLLACVLSIYLICTLIDLLRSNLCERVIFSFKFINTLSLKIDRILNERNPDSERS